MTLVEHLSELRRRVVICVVVIVIGGIVGFWKAPDVVVELLKPLPGQKVVLLSLGSGVLLYLKIALITGIGIGLPVIMYQLWAFVGPGLTPAERRQILPLIPLSVVFFALGLAVAYVTLPYAIAFLAGFQIPGSLELFPTGEAYFGFVTMIFLVFGTVMEFPIVLVLLAKLGVVRPERLRASRRVVLLGIVVFAVVVTPGGDPVSPTVMSVVMYALYEFTIFFLGRRPSEAPADDAEPGGTDG
ncbi:MAG: sec-independent protein translocase protein TatC [Chloroflexota bacterium]|jgi:sec-independent protein translocase protein TatC|nr:sec-independent protein translocase protein TatC [Chloroflexota bacterium]